MKAQVKLDKRPEIDKKYDLLWNKLLRESKINTFQSQLVARYVRVILMERMKEIQSVDDMAWLLALIEVEGFGTDVSKGAKRLPRVQEAAANIRNDAYSHSCTNANGIFQDYDDCGVEHLQCKLKRYNIEYDVNA